MKRYVYAQAKSKADVGADLEQGVDELIMHLIKLRLYPHSTSVNHWRREVAEKLHRTDVFKRSHKLPSAEFILDNTYRVNEKFLANYLHVVVTDYGRPQSFDRSALFDDIRDYFEWIANELSQSRSVAYGDIYQKLEKLGF